jgi:hypothetical protein
VNALVLFAALMGVAEPALPHHAQLADALVPLALLWMLRRLPRPAGAWAAAAAYLAWAALSAAIHAAGGWKILGVAELACLAVLAASLDEDERARVVRAWVLGAAALAGVALLVSSLSAAGVDTPWAAGGGELGWSFRPKGLAASTNLLASLCLVPLLVAAAERRWGLAALFGVVLLLAASRTILAAGVGLALLWRPRGWKWLIGALIGTSLASMYVDIHGAGGPGIRWRIAASALQTALHHPLVGVGPTARPAMAGWPGAGDPALSWDAHSTPPDVAATLGLPALLALALVFRRSLRRAEGVLAVALWATLFDALTLDVEDFRHLWLLLGLAMAARRSWRPPPPSGTTAGATS